MNKTKPKVQVKWPKGLFTIAQLQKTNPSIVNITLRFKINKRIENGEIVAIGKNPTAMGRPTLVFAPTNVSVEQLDAAKKRGVILETEYDKQTTVTSTIVADYNSKTTKPSPKTIKTPTPVAAETPSVIATV